VAGRTLTREEVAEAAWRVIVREGLDRTSVRAIGRELGASSGVVTYHFRDKTELLSFALDRLTAAIERAVDQAAAGAEGIERVRRTMAAILPTGPREVAGWRIWIAFLGQSIGSARLGAEHGRRLEILSQRLTAQIGELDRRGAIRRGLAPRAEADALIAFADGIGVGYLLRPTLFPPERQIELIDQYLVDRLGAALPRLDRKAADAKAGPRRL
ncbi:MAG: TetR/AcrR family transcriptional regulator, partial [Gemmatimonadales bacterium]